MYCLHNIITGNLLNKYTLFAATPYTQTLQQENINNKTITQSVRQEKKREMNFPTLFVIVPLNEKRLQIYRGKSHISDTFLFDNDKNFKLKSVL